MKKLFLIDASNMFFRAFYAIRPLTNSKGLPTNALYGYISMTIKLMREMKPDYMAYCFDSKEPGFRSTLYPEYKAHRSDMPEDLVPQVPYFKKINEALGIPIFQMSGVEADDIIGTIACYARDQNIETTIISGDKDFAQLIGPMVKMYDTMKDVVYDVPGVKEKWGIRPDQMIDYLALIGDASDNIPGIAGVGPKTAQKLLDQYKSLDDIYENIDSVKPDKLREKFKANKEIAYLCKELVTIKVDLDLNLSIEALTMKPVPREETVALLNELEFKTFERKIFGSNSEPSPDAAPAPQKLDAHDPSVLAPADTKEPASVEKQKFADVSEKEVNAAELEKLLKQNHSLWALPNNRGLFVADEKNVYILQDDLDKFSKLFDKKEVSWKGFDLKSFWRSLKLQVPRAEWDHQIASYVLYPKPVGDFNTVYEENFHMKLPDFPSPSEFLKFNLELEAELRGKLERQNGLEVYEKFDLPLIPVLYSMEKDGILIDCDILHKQSEILHKDIRALELEIYKQAGETFNIASPKQLSQVLFEKLKLTPIRKTKTGQSTDSDVLEKLESQHTIAKYIIEYRELAKLKSTYVDSLPLLIADDKRIHSIFNQAITSTGRLSSTNPNLQNIPIRTERGNAVRKAFVAASNHELISADYSQIELRVMAHVTGDPGLVRAFENDLDIHAATAAEVFNVPLSDVTPDLRRIAKAVNFGLAYGMGAHGLAENLGIPRKEAADIITRYFMKFALVKNYMTEVIETAKKQGFVETIFGRRRYTPELNSKNGNIRAGGERAAINAPMQGTASDIVKKAMIDIYEQTPKDLPHAKMILQVHDELIFEVPKKDVPEYREIIQKKMENVVQLKVPLKVNVSSGPSWFEAD